jgi:hypothetical protein
MLKILKIYTLPGFEPTILCAIPLSQPSVQNNVLLSYGTLNAHEEKSLKVQKECKVTG